MSQTEIWWSREVLAALRMYVDPGIKSRTTYRRIDLEQLDGTLYAALKDDQMLLSDYDRTLLARASDDICALIESLPDDDDTLEEEI